MPTGETIRIINVGGTDHDVTAINETYWGSILGDIGSQTDLVRRLNQHVSYEDNGKLGAKNLFNINSVRRKYGVDVVSNGLKNTLLTDSSSTVSLVVQCYKASTYVTSLIAESVSSLGEKTYQLDIDSNIDYDNLKIGHSGTTQDLAAYINFDKHGLFVLSLKFLGIDPTTLNGFSFSDAMIRLASDPDNTFEPYAKTNNELTLGIQEVTRTISSASAGAQIRIPESGTDSRIANTDDRLIVPVCNRKNDGTRYKFRSCVVDNGYATITVGEALSNVKIGVAIFKF